MNNILINILELYMIYLVMILTIRSTTASGERSFSAMKQIKSFQRSTQNQDRLSSMLIISIEK